MRYFLSGLRDMQLSTLPTSETHRWRAELLLHGAPDVAKAHQHPIRQGLADRTLKDTVPEPPRRRDHIRVGASGAGCPSYSSSNSASPGRYVGGCFVLSRYPPSAVWMSGRTIAR